MSSQITIGALARAAEVGVETVRYYQRRGLLPGDGAKRGAFRVYGDADVARLRFIRRAQSLGFTLDEIAGLLALDVETDRDEARRAARAKIADIDARMRQLQNVREALQELVRCCESAVTSAPCPILRALGGAPEPDTRTLPAPQPAP